VSPEIYLTASVLVCYGTSNTQAEIPEYLPAVNIQ